MANERLKLKPQPHPTSYNVCGCSDDSFGTNATDFSVELYGGSESARLATFHALASELYARSQFWQVESVYIAEGYIDVYCDMYCIRAAAEFCADFLAARGLFPVYIDNALDNSDTSD